MSPNHTAAVAVRLELLAKLIGFAVLQVQALESASAEYLVLRSKAKRGMGASEASALIERAKREPFGITVGGMAKAGLLSSELELRFRNVLKERNWLIHRSRSDNSAAMRSDEATSALLQRVQGIADDSVSLIREISELTTAFVRDAGVSQEAIDAATRDITLAWERNDAI